MKVQTVVVCNEPTNLAVSGLTATNATVAWSAPNPAPQNGYEYVLSTVNTVPVSAGTSHLTLSKQFFNLIPNTTYHFFIRPVCENGIFGDWELIIFKTLPGSTASVGELNELELAVYPNPVTDLLTIDAGDEAILEEARIVDLLGKTVVDKRLQGSFAEISLKDLPNGTYYLTVRTNKGSKNLPVTLIK
ncbi:Fibronectin type III domain protein [compost metagenome]